MKKILALVLALSMLLGMCAVASAEGKALVSWYTFGDVYLTSVRTALDAAFADKGITVTDKDSNAIQTTQTEFHHPPQGLGHNAFVPVFPAHPFHPVSAAGPGRTAAGACADDGERRPLRGPAGASYLIRTD